MTFIRAYLRASSEEQDAFRAKNMLEEFAKQRSLLICNFYVENESGARLNRPELFRLLNDSHTQDILLVEDIDRLSRLSAIDWENLKQMLRDRDIRIVAVNVPTTWMHLVPNTNEFDSRMFSAINGMLIDMLAAIARRDYDQRKYRQKQGIAKAKDEKKYKGRKANIERYSAINRLLENNCSWSEVQRVVKCSRGTISYAKKYKSLQESKL